MKAATALVSISIFALMSVSAAAAPVLIAGTSFENELVGTKYEDGGDATVNHTLVNNPGQSTVNSTITSANAGDLGFSASYVFTGDTSGMADGADVGVVGDTSDVGHYSAGVQGYEISNSDSDYILTFDSVDLTGHTSVNFIMSFYIAETSWEGDQHEHLKISLSLDGNLIDLFDTTGQDIDDDYHEYEGKWASTAYGIGDSVQTVSLIINAASNGSTEKFFFDNVRFQGEPIPEPASMALLGLGALIALRKKK